MDSDRDERIRVEVFQFLHRRTMLDPEGLISWQDLVDFKLASGEPLVLIGAAGIWKPRQLQFPISVTTAPPRADRPAPYEDAIRPDGTVAYRYRGTDPTHRDNAGLRTIVQRRLPIAYFVGVEKGRYLAHFPTYAVHDDPTQGVVTLSLESASVAPGGLFATEPADEALRRYVAVAARHRLHQARFRSMVMHAYRCRCAVCSLAKPVLLDAAHIIEDSDPTGIAAVTNGLSLCKIHHAAYDQNLLGIDPDLRVHIAGPLLDEVDGPMLQHGLKEMHGRSLAIVPSRSGQRPDRDRLARRFAEFRIAE